MSRKTVYTRHFLTSRCGFARWFSVSSAISVSTKTILASQTRENSTQLSRSQFLDSSLLRLRMGDATDSLLSCCSQLLWLSWELITQVEDQRFEWKFWILNFSVFAGMKVNALDLSPNYAGTLMGITNGIGALTGIAAVSLKHNDVKWMMMMKQISVNFSHISWEFWHPIELWPNGD